MEKDEILDYVNAIYQNACVALQSINDIIDKVENTDLQNELKKEYRDYEKVSLDCEAFAKVNDLNISDNNWFEKARLWTSIKLSTMSDKTTRHIAELMLIGTVMGLLTCYKDKYDHKNISIALDNILTDLTRLEDANYKSLKTFLEQDVE